MLGMTHRPCCDGHHKNTDCAGWVGAARSYDPQSTRNKDKMAWKSDDDTLLEISLIIGLYPLVGNDEGTDENCHPLLPKCFPE